MKRTIWLAAIPLLLASLPARAVDYYDPATGAVKASPNAVTLTTQTALSGGWYVVPAGTTTIGDRITVSGSVNLVLSDDATLNAMSGITVAEGNSLTIWGQGGEHAVPGTSATTRGTGALNAQTPGSGTYSQAAAIGGGNGGTTGDIVVNGGVIVARGSWGAGIGRGNVAGGAVGSVTIHEGHVTASGNRGSAGIGSGAYADSCPVTISGGYVVAAGCVYDATGQATPGIGTGRPRTDGSQPLSNGTITITGGTVVAQAGDGSIPAQAIGVNSADADHNGTSHLILGAVRAYASAGATTPVAVSARGNTCRGAWVKLETCTSHGDANSDSFCDYCGGYCGPVPPTGSDGALVISTDSDWDAFASLVNVGGETCQGKTVRLAADVGTATTPVGTADHPFAGTFNGGGHTLTVNLAGANPSVAPFAHVAGATIRNLKVAGAVSGAMHCSGLVGGIDGGPNMIENCEVAAAIATSGTHFGGFVGHGGTSATTLRGCVFSGGLPGGNVAGTFWGWSDDGSSATLIDCLDTSASTHPVGRSEGAVCVSNTYYFASKDFGNGDRLWSANKRGKRAYAVTAGEGVEIDFGAPAATYDLTGITAYPVGMVYRGSGTPAASSGTFYAGEGDAVSLDLFPATPFGMALDAYIASAGTLSPDGGAWTLAMPAANVAVNVTWKSAQIGSGTSADPYRIGDGATWTALADAVDRGLDTAGLHFVMTADIGPVTNMVGTADHPFGGVFNGTGHMLELAIADTANMGTAPFRYIKDAVLANVKTTGTVNGSMHCAGLVGFAQGTNRIMQCEVAAGVVCGGATHSHCGGILGHGLSSDTTIRNCLFSGSISGATDATGVIYGWGDGGGVHAIENCLESGGYSMTLGLALLRTCGGEEVVQNCYRRNDGVSGGADAGTLSDGELLAALGAGWEIRGGKVVPVVADEKDFMLATVRGLESVIYVNAGSDGVRPAVTVADLRGATVDPSFYTVTIRDGDGAVVVGDLAFDSYTLTVQALEGNAGGYTGSRTIPFDTCPAGLSIDRDYGRGETGRYYVNTSHVESEYEPVVVTLPEGFHTSFKVYDNGGKNDNYGVYGDDVLVLTAPEGCGLRISGTVAVRYDDCMSILDSDGRAFIDRMSTGESPVAIPVLTSCGRSLTICLFPYGAGPVEGFNFTVDIERRIDLASLTGDATISDGAVVHGTLAGNYKVSIASGATVTLRDVTIDGVDDPSCPWAGLTCLGDAAIVLAGVNAVRGFHHDYPGISVPEGATLSVSGDGSLTVSRNGGAGEGVAGTVALSGMAVATNGTTQVFTTKVVNLASLRTHRVLLDGEIATGVLMGDYQVSIADGATVTLRNATLVDQDGYKADYWAGLTCLGDATVVLEGANAVKGFYNGYPGIFVPSGKTLTIRGGGSLDATGGDDAPGIGATDDTACGTIVIEGGTVHATGVGEAAGIGGGGDRSASCDGIVVRGGTVVARGGGDPSDYGGGAGIGGTFYSQFGSVVINGGTVTAYGGYGADGIGCGNGDVTINGGTVTAYGGSYGSGIGGCGNVVVNGGTVVAEGGAECPGIGGGCDSVVIAGGTVTAVGGPDGAGIGAGTYVSCGSVTIGPDIVRVTATCDDASDCCPIGNGYGGTCDAVTVAPGLRDTTTGLTRVIERVLTGFEAWASTHNVSGAWNETDALGVHNVFRYAFDVPEGPITNPPLLSISFDASGNPVVLTPPLVNATGFTLSILATDDLDGANATTYPLDTGGETTIPKTETSSRFFRLRAVEQ